MSCALIVALSLAASPASPGSPLEVVKRGNTTIQSLLKSPDASVERLAMAVDQFVDFGELAKRALGREWNRLSPAQQQDFSTTMKGLLRASYAQRALGQGAAEIRYGAEKRDGKEAEVTTTLLLKKDELPVAYRLYKVAGRQGWRIFDVVTDEVSLVETYRGQFRKLIADKGYDGLLTTLKNKRAQLERSASASAPQASN
ncbi:MAG: phospholipid-binding protein MlaC [Myxococcaceae bacterium]